MREDHAHGGRLVRPRRLRPPLIARLELGWIAAGALGLALIDRPSELDCERAMHTRTPGAAVSICAREYRDTRNPAVGALLAGLWRQAGQREAARALATRLLDTPERASGLQILGKIAIDEHRLDEARARSGPPASCTAPRATRQGSPATTRRWPRSRSRTTGSATP